MQSLADDSHSQFGALEQCSDLADEKESESVPLRGGTRSGKDDPLFWKEEAVASYLLLVPNFRYAIGGVAGGVVDW